MRNVILCLFQEILPNKYHDLEIHIGFLETNAYNICIIYIQQSIKIGSHKHVSN